MENELYWSLVIEPGWVQAAIWTIEGDSARVISVGPSTSWETDDDLITSADTSLTGAAQELSENEKEPTKTVFGVIPSWVADGEIKAKHLGTIRKICSKLSLSPSGFVVLPEAIAHSFKLDKGSPLNGVIIGLGKTNIDVTIIKLGNLVGTVTVGRSVSVIDDVLEGLARFATGDHLPSRFLVYDGKEVELEEVRQDLIKADWKDLENEKVKFLHTPQVEVITPDEKMVAVCLAGASEIGDIKKVVAPKKQEEEVESEGLPSPEAAEGQEKEDIISAEEAGFTSEQSPQMKIEKSDNIEPVTRAKSGKSKFAFLGMLTPALSKIKSLVRKTPRRRTLPTVKLPTGGRRRPIYIISAFILVLVASIFAAWWFLPKATITIYITPKTLEEVMTITLDESAASPDLDNQVLPADVIDTVVSGERTKAATGAKTVGDKATGKVTIRNGTSSDINLKAGSLLSGPNDLRFVVDESASVSAATSPSSPGTAVVAVTADSIGPDYNLAKDESFSVANYPTSEVDAVVETELSGGSSRDIVAVSADDIESLEEELTDELILEGRNSIEDEGDSNQIFISDAVRTEVVSKSFSQKVGDEAQSLTLTLEVKVIGLVTSKSTINQFAAEILNNQTPSGFVLREEQIDVDLNLSDEDDGVWTFDADVRANLLPEINTDEVISKVSGKYPPLAQEFLSTIPGYSGAEIKISPRFPGRLGNIPRVLGNIEVEIVAEK